MEGTVMTPTVRFKQIMAADPGVVAVLVHEHHTVEKAAVVAFAIVESPAGDKAVPLVLDNDLARLYDPSESPAFVGMAAFNDHERLRHLEQQGRERRERETRQ
jgi:hypothetical protein